MPDRDGGYGEPDGIEPPAAGPVGGDCQAAQHCGSLDRTQVVLRALTNGGRRGQLCAKEALGPPQNWHDEQTCRGQDDPDDAGVSVIFTEQVTDRFSDDIGGHQHLGSHGESDRATLAAARSHAAAVFVARHAPERAGKDTRGSKRGALPPRRTGQRERGIGRRNASAKKHTSTSFTTSVDLTWPTQPLNSGGSAKTITKPHTR